MKKLRFVRSKSKQGLDGCAFEVEFIRGPEEGSKLYIKNPNGWEYGTVEIKGGVGIVRLVLARFLRGNNVIPFGVADLSHIETIRNDCLNQIE